MLSLKSDGLVTENKKVRYPSHIFEIREWAHLPIRILLKTKGFYLFTNEYISLNNSIIKLIAIIKSHLILLHNNIKLFIVIFFNSCFFSMVI